MFEVPVYRAEVADGISEAVKGSGRLVVASAALPSTLDALSPAQLARARAVAGKWAGAARSDFDLHYIDTVLVTTGWNKNDDVFDRVETWVARKTPEDKQLNYAHDDARIVGHIVSNTPVKVDGTAIGEAIPDGTSVDDLPPKFHLLAGAVLFKCWQTPELQERMDDILAAIARNELAVSMECLFNGFDYALKSAAGTKVVARNEQTAFLSKHLRCYGGTGAYGEYRVGRLLRNIVFSGMGLVKDPANPESVILPPAEAFSPAAADFQTFFPERVSAAVYSIPTDEVKIKVEELMTPEQIEALKAELAAAKADNAKLKAGQSETEIAELKARLDAATAAKTDLEGKLAKAEADLKAAGDEAAKAKAQLDEVAKTLAEAQDEVKTLHADKAKAERVAAIKSKLNYDDATAATFHDLTEALPADKFAAHLDAIAKTVAAKAPEAPKAPEADKAGEAAAKTTDLGTAQAKTEPALATAGDAEVNAVRETIAAQFGWTKETE